MRRAWTRLTRSSTGAGSAVGTAPAEDVTAAAYTRRAGTGSDGSTAPLERRRSRAGHRVGQGRCGRGATSGLLALGLGGAPAGGVVHLADQLLDDVLEEQHAQHLAAGAGDDGQVRAGGAHV